MVRMVTSRIAREYRRLSVAMNEIRFAAALLVLAVVAIALTLAIVIGVIVVVNWTLFVLFISANGTARQQAIVAAGATCVVACVLSAVAALRGLILAASNRYYPAVGWLVFAAIAQAAGTVAYWSQFGPETDALFNAPIIAATPLLLTAAALMWLMGKDAERAREAH